MKTDNCKCGKSKSIDKEKCFFCLMEDNIRTVIPNITNEQMDKMKGLIDDYIMDAWNVGAQEAANDIGSRM